MDESAGTALVNALDIGVIVLLLISAVLAYARGFVHEVLSIAGWIGAILATIYGFPYLKPYARELTDIGIVADFGAGIVIFVVSLVLFSVLTRRISGRIKDSALNAVDRSLGFLFGLLRGALVVVIAYIGVGLVYPEDERPAWISEARSMELVEPGAALLTALIPDSLTGGKAAEGEEASDGTPGGRKRVVQDLMAPTPKGAEQGDGGAVGYDEKERQQMERLQDSVRDR